MVRGISLEHPEQRKADEKGERVWRKNGQLKWKESGLNMRLKWSFNVFLRFPGGFAEEDQPISSSRMRVH